MSSFKEIINSGQPVLVDFYAEWCAPCKAMTPVLKELSGEYKDKAQIIKIDVDKNIKAATHYQVRGVPTFILFKDGEIKWRQAGILSAQQIRDLINSYL